MLARLSVVLAALLLGLSIVPQAAAPAAGFVQGFEVDASGWSPAGAVTRQASGTAGDAYAPAVAASEGGYLGRAAVILPCGTGRNGGGATIECYGPYTRWGQSSPYPPFGEYTTTLDIYLDVAYASANPPCGSECPGSRFDWTAGYGTREVAFNVGTSPGAGFTACPVGYVIAVGYNSLRSGADPYSAASQTCVAVSGWYTFTHHLRSVSGFIVADLSITSVSTSAVVASWTLVTGDPIVGASCARYGWFAIQEMPGLAIDRGSMRGCPPIAEGTLSVTKFYDANANGAREASESNITGWRVLVNETPAITPATLELAPGTYYVNESRAAGSAWIATTPTNTTASVGSGATTSVAFGNVCIGGSPGGTARSLGYWTSKAGVARVTSTDLANLSALNLVDARGQPFDPASAAALGSWLNGAKATNMAYMLSAQLAAVELDFYHGLVSGSDLVYAPGTTSANSAGFATVSALVSEAAATLVADGYTPSGDPHRALQQALKNALDGVATGRNFVQTTPCAFSFG